MINTNKLKGRIVEICGTIAKFSELMGFSSTTATKRINGADWKADEIVKAASILLIPVGEITDYFFAQLPR